MLERDDVIESIEGEYDEDNKGTVVPIRLVKAKPKEGIEEHPEGSAELQLLKQEDFDALLAAVSGRVQDMAEEITAGRLDIAPRRTDHERSACTYCDYKGICKFDQDFPECRYVHIHKQEDKQSPQEEEN